MATKQKSLYEFLRYTLEVEKEATWHLELPDLLSSTSFSPVSYIGCVNHRFWKSSCWRSEASSNSWLLRSSFPFGLATQTLCTNESFTRSAAVLFEAH